jgi:hypothetical protein
MIGELMMMKKVLASIALMSSTTSMAAPLGNSMDAGARQSSAAAGFYFSIPFGGERSLRPQAGLRLRATHDYRNTSAPTAPVYGSDTLDLRLIGERKPTLYIGGMQVTGDEERKSHLTGATTLVTVAVLAAAAVGAVVILDAVNGDDDDDKQCLIPEGCP